MPRPCQGENSVVSFLVFAPFGLHHGKFDRQPKLKRNPTLLWTLLLILSVHASNPSKAFADLCVPTIVGTDTSTFNTSVDPDFGKALGQPFLVRDTLIQSITVMVIDPGLTIDSIEL